MKPWLWVCVLVGGFATLLLGVVLVEIIMAGDLNKVLSCYQALELGMAEDIRKLVCSFE